MSQSIEEITNWITSDDEQVIPSLHFSQEAKVLTVPDLQPRKRTPSPFVDNDDNEDEGPKNIDEADTGEGKARWKALKTAGKVRRLRESFVRSVADLPRLGHSSLAQ